MFSDDTVLRVRSSLVERGFAEVAGREFDLGAHTAGWNVLAAGWERLVVDPYMGDGGRYRLRRFGRWRFVPGTGELSRLKHAPVYQTRYVNTFAGGIHRVFEPLEEQTFRNPSLLALIREDFELFTFPEQQRGEPWEVWVHQIRIAVEDEMEVSPAPEGIHHDGHDCIAMHLVRRENVVGGRNVLYDSQERPVHSTLITDPLDTIYADDHRVMHAVDPISVAVQGRRAYRDMLIIDFDHRPRLTAQD